MENAALRQELDQLRKTWNAAWLENDSATVDKLMAPEYVYIAGNGQILDRAAIMGVILSPSYKLHRASWTEIQINLLSDSAAVIIDRLQGAGHVQRQHFYRRQPMLTRLPPPQRRLANRLRTSLGNTVVVRARCRRTPYQFLERSFAL